MNPPLPTHSCRDQITFRNCRDLDADAIAGRSMQQWLPWCRPAGITGSWKGGSSLGRDYHVYSVNWEPGRIRWYVNDELYHAVTPADVNGNPWVFDHDFFLLVNMAVGGTASVRPDSSDTFPQAMLIDYIRIYAPAAPPA
jgi:hypothetical protein